ncbi:peptidoglycan-binding protein [Methylobacterium terricola]|uniref:Peptidoglycan-binding protein n=1 Tax=Methylobacterium terricola TaxID=2583531 RepID=A0A5C4LKU5_9HYPH|nr:peptidoglycan-binding domain-containing protein [Methylobacterium terricola]TNC13691.1 peptidoglycan-binding protein [Methylobacterium terricola]
MALRQVFLAGTVLAALAGGSAHAQQSAVSNQRTAQDQSEGQGTQIFVSSAGVRQIQQALTQKGYSTGNVDGRWNAQTTAAARSFQQAQNMEPTGTLTVPLVYGLGLDQDIILGNTGAQGGGQSGDQGTKQADNQRVVIERADSRGTPLHVSPAGIRQIQQALNQQGWNTGQVDGRWGPATVQAARSYQQVHGLEPTGRLEVGLIAALGLTDPIFSAGHGTGPQAANAARPQPSQAAGTGGDKQVDNQRIAMERADSPGEPLWMNSDGVRQIQQVLNQRGYAAGHLDGNWNTDTALAATHFQQAQGLEPTGTLTTNLLATIGMPRWQRGEFMGGMATTANAAGNPNPQTTGTVSSARGTGASGQGSAGGSASAPSPAGQGGEGQRAAGSR